MPCIMPEQPYCPMCHYGYIVYDKNDDTIVKGTLAGLLPNDKVIMNMNYSHSIKELIAIRD